MNGNLCSIREPDQTQSSRQRHYIRLRLFCYAFSFLLLEFVATVIKSFNFIGIGKVTYLKSAVYHFKEFIVSKIYLKPLPL